GSRPPSLAALPPYTPLFRSGVALRAHAKHVDARLPAQQGALDILGDHRPGVRRVRGKDCFVDGAAKLWLHHAAVGRRAEDQPDGDRKSTRLNSSHVTISYAV